MKGAAPRSRLLACFGLLITIGLLAGPAPLASAAPKPPATPTPPAAPQPATPPAVAAPSTATETWVQNFEVTEQWSGPNEGAEFFGWLRKFSYLRVERAEGERYYVF